MRTGIRAVVLAAGEGRRMRPLTYTRPKVMLPIAGRPILEHLLLGLREAGVTGFTFVVGYCADKVREYFGDGGRWGVEISYVLQKRQLGTAHALGSVEGFVEEPEFLVLNGDVILEAEDIRRVLDAPPPALGAVRAEAKEEAGFVEVEGERVVRIHEKPKHPPSDLLNTGIYRLDRRVFEFIARTPKSPRNEYELTETLQLMADAGVELGWRKLKSWLALSYPWDLLEANEILLSRLEPQNLGEVEPGAVVKGPVGIGRNTLVRAGSYIEGPVLIGEGCEIGPNCYIRPFTSIGDGCRIGAAVEVKNSIIMRGTKIPHHNYVGDSIIGEDCNLGAGTKIANLRLDRRNVVVEGRETGRRKLGAIIGDRVEVGINASINVGTVIGNDSFIGPGALVEGVVHPRSRIL